MAESSGDPGSTGDVSLQDSTWGPSLGLWQIRSIKAESGTGSIRDGSQLYDPGYNAHSAYILFKGQGFKPWTTYTNGAYKKFLDAARAAATGAGTTLPADYASPNAPAITSNPEELKSVFTNFVGRDPTQDEIAQYTGQSSQDVEKAIGGTTESEAFRTAAQGNALRQIMGGK